MCEPKHVAVAICESKTTFVGEAAAQAWCDKLHDARGVQLRPYLCWVCHGWHTTTTGRRKRVDRKKRKEAKRLRRAFKRRERFTKMRGGWK